MLVLCIFQAITERTFLWYFLVLTFRAGGPKNGVMVPYKNISCLRVESSLVFALVMGGSELMMRVDDAHALARQISEWLRFATGRAVEDVVSI